jgi:cation diffusion facilitator CzcD-associated flavoprotein CzcO
MLCPSCYVPLTHTLPFVAFSYPSLTNTHSHRLLSFFCSPTYPEFLPKDVIGDFLKAYAVGQNLVVWTHTTLIPNNGEGPPVYNDKEGRWRVEIVRRRIGISCSPLTFFLVWHTQLIEYFDSLGWH